MKRFFSQIATVLLVWLLVIATLHFYPQLLSGPITIPTATNNDSTLAPQSQPALLMPVMDSCEALLTKLCGPQGDEPGRGGCIIANRDKIPQNCSKHLKENMDAYAVCEKDVKKHCASVPFGQWRQLKCLWEHEKNLSKDCHAFVKDRRSLFQ